MPARRVSKFPFPCALCPELCRHELPSLPSLPPRLFPLEMSLSPSAAPGLPVLAGRHGQNQAAEVIQHNVLRQHFKDNY